MSGTVFGNTNYGLQSAGARNNPYGDLDEEAIQSAVQRSNGGAPQAPRLDTGAVNNALAKTGSTYQLPRPDPQQSAPAAGGLAGGEGQAVAQSQNPMLEQAMQQGQQPQQKKAGFDMMGIFGKLFGF